jgi:hypothetical protein
VGCAQLKPPLFAQVPASVSKHAPPAYGQHKRPFVQPGEHMLLQPRVPPEQLVSQLAPMSVPKTQVQLLVSQWAPWTHWTVSGHPPGCDAHAATPRINIAKMNVCLMSRPCAVLGDYRRLFSLPAEFVNVPSLPSAILRASIPSISLYRA